jgi:serine/threonine protein kinase
MLENHLPTIIRDVFRTNLNSKKLPENSEEFKLSNESFSIPFSFLIRLNHMGDNNYNTLLDSLTLYAASKEPKIALDNLLRLKQAYEFLINNVDKAYTEAVRQGYKDSLEYISTSITSIAQVLSYSQPLKELKSSQVDVQGILDYLYISFSSLMWTEIDRINNDLSGKANDIQNLITYLIQSQELEFEIETLKDAVVDLVIDYIEFEIDYFGMLERNEKEIRKDTSGLKNIIGYARHLHCNSELSLKRLAKYEEKIGFNQVQRPESAVVDNRASGTIGRFTQQRTSFYSRNHGDINVSLYRGKSDEGRDIVIKTYTKLSEIADLQKFYEEIRVFQRISERATPDNAFLKFYGVEADNEKVSILLESCEKDLMAKITEIQESKNPNQRFTEEQIIDITKKLLNAFAELETMNIYHRDIKPHNILINKLPNDLYSVKITDFSISEIKIDFESTTAYRPIQGTKGYMAPELAESMRPRGLKGAGEMEETKYGKALINPVKADVFSLGLTILQMIILEDLTTLNLKEYHNQLLAKLDGIKPDWLKNLLEKMLELDPSTRKTFKELLFYLPGGSGTTIQV